MKKLAAICIERPVFAAMLILGLVVVGSASYMRLGVDRFPAMDLPSVFIRTTLPGASPEEVEVLISQPIEEAVNTVQGLDELRSISGAGSSIATSRRRRRTCATASPPWSRVCRATSGRRSSASPTTTARRS